MNVLKRLIIIASDERPKKTSIKQNSCTVNKMVNLSKKIFSTFHENQRQKGVKNLWENSEDFELIADNL